MGERKARVQRMQLPQEKHSTMPQYHQKVTKPAQKVLREGQLLIIRNGETYNATGVRL